MHDMPMEQLLDWLRARRDNGPGDLHELVYQLASHVRSLQQKLEVAREDARRALMGPRP